VDPAMLHQRRALPEALPALPALVRFFHRRRLAAIRSPPATRPLLTTRTRPNRADPVLPAIRAGWGLPRRPPGAVGALVLEQSGPLSETPPALGAAEEAAVPVGGQEAGEMFRTTIRRPFGRVDLLVAVEVGADAEALPAFGAGVGAFAGVDALVTFQVGALDEAFAAVGAGEGPLAGVDAPVLGEVGPAAEALPAVAAAVRPLAAVRLAVFGQGGALGEGLAAFGAAVRSR